MKNFWMISPLVVFAAILTLSQSAVRQLDIPASTDRTGIAPDSSIIYYPPKVKALIDAKCYDCHSENGEDEEAKEELMWDALTGMSKIDQLYALDAIIESIEDEEMPPEDYVDDHPEAALSKEEAKLLIDWADAIADKLME